MRTLWMAFLTPLAFALPLLAQSVATTWSVPVGTTLISDGIVVDLARLDDVNADGVADLLVGMKPFAHDTTAGFPDGFAEIRSGADGALIHTLAPQVAASSFGIAVVTIDDVDGDGINDAGVLQHVFSSGSLYEARVEVFSTATGAHLRTLVGPLTVPPSCPTVACVTDLNGDGTREVAICSTGDLIPFVATETRFVDPLGVAPTQVLLSPLQQNGQSSVTAIDDRDGDGQADFIYSSGLVNVPQVFSIRSGADLSEIATLAPVAVSPATSSAGQHVRTIGDVNRDGTPDIIVPDNFSNVTRVFDSATGFPLNFPPIFPIDVQYFYHQATGGLGDVDGDGFDDYFLIDDISDLHVYSGRFHRRQSAWEGEVNLGNVVRSVRAMGDLDGDGFDDFAVGASNFVRLMSVGGARQFGAPAALDLAYRHFDVAPSVTGALDLTGAAPFASGVIGVSLGELAGPGPILLDTTPDQLVLSDPFTVDFHGRASFGVNLAQPLLAGQSVFVQAATTSGGVPAFSNGTELLFVSSRVSVDSVSPRGFLGGENITVMGSGFEPGVTVFIEGVQVPAIFVNGSNLQFTAPPPTAYGVEMVIRNPGGETVREQVNPTPAITFVSPAAGPASGGAIISIQGGPFPPGTTATVGGAPLSITGNLSFLLVGSTPPGPIGLAQVVVSVPAPGGGVTTLTADYTYQ